MVWSEIEPMMGQQRVEEGHACATDGVKKEMTRGAYSRMRG